MRWRTVIAGFALLFAGGLAETSQGPVGASAASGDISSVVGGVAGGPATTVPQNPVALALDGGALLVSDGTTGTIRSIDPVTRNESAPVGNACIGHSGDGGPAGQATIAAARAVAVGPDGSIYIAESAWNDVRRVSPSGIISNFAGRPNTTGAYGGDGGAATQADLHDPEGLAVDQGGNVYISDYQNGRVRKVDTGGTITTFAGGGSNTGDGVPATQASLGGPSGLAVDDAGNVYVASQAGIRKISGGLISTIGGDGQWAAGVAWANGIVYFTDSYTQRAYQIGPLGQTLIAGNGTAGYSGDGGPATAAELNHPVGIAADAAGNVFIADTANNRVRVVTGGTISTYAGTGSLLMPSGTAASGAQVTMAQKVVIDGQGGYYFSEEFQHVVRHVDAVGRMTTVAGNGTPGFSGDGGPATSAQLNNPLGLAVASGGDLYIADQTNGRIRRVHNGIISTFAGGGPGGSTIGDGGPALGASLAGPQYLAFDSAGNLYISDNGGSRVRKVDTAGTITTYAGGGGADPGDGGPATSAYIGRPAGLAFDATGDLFIADDSYRSVIRRVDGATHVITTVAGTRNVPGYGGDQGPATSAYVSFPQDVAVDAGGDLFIADTGNNRIRAVVNGTITTAFGTGVDGCQGDNGTAWQAQIGSPEGSTLDAGGNLYISEGNRIRLVSDAVGWVTGKPSPTPAPSASPTLSATPTPSATSTPTPSATSTPTPSATSTPSPSATATPSPTTTPTATPAPSPRPTSGPESNFHQLTPVRILDTRNNIGHSGAVAGGRSIDLQLTGNHGVPASGVTAVLMNVTVTDTSASSYLTVYPTGTQRPLASNLNWRAGVTVPNLVQVATGHNGDVTFFNAAGLTDVVADLEGYFSADSSGSGSLRYVASTPNRILDTRKAGSHPLGPGETISVFMAAPQLKQYSATINVTATDATAASYLTLWPHGVSRPTASNLNFSAGQTIANRVTVGVDTDNNQYMGYVDIYNAAGSVDVIVDVDGVFQDAASWPYGRFQAVQPVRILDTRDGTGGAAGPVGPGGTVVLPVAGQFGIPSDVQVVVGNLTVTDTSSSSYLTAWSHGDSRPTASDLNWTPGATVPNMTVVLLSRDGKIDIYNAAGMADVIFDVTGWYR